MNDRLVYEITPMPGECPERYVAAAVASATDAAKAVLLSCGQTNGGAAAAKVKVSVSVSGPPVKITVTVSW